MIAPQRADSRLWNNWCQAARAVKPPLQAKRSVGPVPAM